MGDYFGRNGKTYTLENDPFASGGEGEVYNIIGNNDKVAKIYKSKKFKPNRYVPDPKTYMKEKIETMLDQPVNPYINGVLCIAYPTDILYDANGEFVGYVMPRVNATKSIITGEREKSREVFFRNYTYKHSVIMSYNMAYLVSKIHEAGVSIGDFNPQNFMLNTDGTITIVDADSFNIRNKRTGKIYKCNVGVPEMLPPELQGKKLENPNCEFNEYTDNFGLAIHIFLLLMNNRHPFTVVMPQNTRSSVAGSKLEKNIAEGKCPFTTFSKWKKNTPLGSMDIGLLPDYIRNLFDRTFTYDVNNAMSDSVIRGRATANEWLNALSRFINEIDNKKRNLHSSSGNINKNISIPKLSNGIAKLKDKCVVIKKQNSKKQVRLEKPKVVEVLWSICIIAGLISGLLFSEHLREWIYNFRSYEISATWSFIMMGIFGVSVGALAGWIEKNMYEKKTSWFLMFLPFVLIPLVTFWGGKLGYVGIDFFIFVLFYCVVGLAVLVMDSDKS